MQISKFLIYYQRAMKLFDEKLTRERGECQEKILNVMKKHFLLRISQAAKRFI